MWHDSILVSKLRSLQPTQGDSEHAWQRAGRRRRTQFATTFVDARTGRLLDLVQGRSTKAAADWLAEQDPGWRQRIAVAAVDPFEVGTPARSASSCPTRLS